MRMCGLPDRYSVKSIPHSLEVWELTLRAKTLLNTHLSRISRAGTVIVVVRAEIDDGASRLVHVVVLAGVQQRPKTLIIM